MAFKQVQDLECDITIALGGYNKKLKKDNPTSIEGFLLGSRQVADKKKKSGFSFIHVFKTKKGNVGVWGKTDLDRKLEASPLGAMTRASFDKMVPTPNGEMYKFVVEYDEDNTIEVQAPRPRAVSPTTSNIRETEGEAEETAEEEVVDEEEEAIDEEAELRAQEVAAARKAKVDAILKGKTKKSA